MKTATKGKKWVDVYNALKQDVENGGYRRGDSFLTISEVSSRFKVSQITSRKALSALAQENLIIQKPGLGSVIRSSEKIKVHFFIPEEENWDITTFRNIPVINFAILKGALKQAEQERVEIEFINTKFLFRIAQSDPVLIMDGSTKFNLEGPEFGEKKYNLIILHSIKPYRTFHTVRHNLYRAVYYATRHLISRGRRRIGFVTGPLSVDTFLQRYEGYFHALKESGVPFDIKLIRETGGENSQEDFIAVEELLSLKEPPTAICAGNDNRALHILDYCHRQGIKVPEEMAICGIDNIYETEVSRPPLTTVDTGWEEIGARAIRFILELMEKPEREIQDIVVEPKLIVRGST